MSVDFWDTERTGIVAVPLAQQVVDRAVSGTLLPGEAVERDPTTNQISRILLSNQNLGNQEARGYDFTLQYQRQTPWGTFTWLTQATYLDEFLFPQFIEAEFGPDLAEISPVELPIRLPQTKAGTNGKVPASSIGIGTISISSAPCATLMGSTNFWAMVLPRTSLVQPGGSTYRPAMISPDLFRWRANLCRATRRTRRTSHAAKNPVSRKQLQPKPPTTVFPPGDAFYSTGRS